MTSDTPANNEAADRAAEIIARALAQGLMEAEVILAADRDSRVQQVPAQLIETLERFSVVLTRLVEFTEQIGSRLNELTDAVNVLAELHAQQQQQPSAAQHQAAAKPQLPEMEPSFAPGGEGIDVTIAAVPGFQGLMELQRALVRLPQVQSAAVRRYQDDEAAIQLVLQQPMGATAIAEGLTASTGRTIFVDEARPDALRLRLRFLAGQ